MEVDLLKLELIDINSFSDEFHPFPDEFESTPRLRYIYYYENYNDNTVTF